MNTHKKLLKMGFKTCYPHYKHYDNYIDPYRMVPDMYVNESKIINGKRKIVLVKKEHPKWRQFYKLIFAEGINIWVDTDKGQIKTIYLEGDIVEKGVEEIYEFYKNDTILLESKKDIIKLFPKSIQREFILNDLFK